MNKGQKYETLIVQQEAGCATIWLHRPRRRNAINGLMADELSEAIQLLARDAQVRVVVIRGRGDHFCAGGDLEWMGSDPPEGVASPAYILADLFSRLYAFPKPLIGVAHGSAMGGAMGLLAVCDYVIAQKDASFAFSEVTLGIVPATISPFVVKRIGEFRARQLMLSGRRIKADEAMAFGLVEEIADAESTGSRLAEIAGGFAANAPEAMMACKQLIRHVSGHDLNNDLMEHVARVLDEIRKSEEAKEGFAAFLEKRKPRWNESQTP